MQTTWLTLLRRRGAIADSRAIGGWLTITARREAWRVAKVERAPTRWRPRTSTSGCRPASPPRARPWSTTRPTVWRAVEGLNERCRRLLRIIAFEKRPDYARISTELGMPVGWIGPTRGRCLEKLRVALTDQETLMREMSRDELPRTSSTRPVAQVRATRCRPGWSRGSRPCWRWPAPTSTPS